MTDPQLPGGGASVATDDDWIEPAAEDLSRHWPTAIDVLRSLFRTNAGCVSSTALRRELERKGIPDCKALVARMKFFDFANPDSQLTRPEFRWRHHGRSFYSEEAYAAAEASQQVAAEQAAVNASEDAAVTATPPKKSNGQEEARLVRYVRDALEDLYASESGPADREWVFDVHHERAGGAFENVDLVAIHWRSPKVAEIVSIEVKLDFTSRLVQQANNYRRFSDRVWVAVPVQTEFSHAAAELRALDDRLFDYVVELGIGILACRRKQGRSYEVAPIQWPTRNMPDALERDMFVEWHRNLLEEAGAVAPRSSADYPRLV